MEPFAIVELHVTGDAGLEFVHCPVVTNEDVLVLERPPEPLDIDVVQRTVYAVHANLDAVLDEHARERERGELAALIRVHDRRDSIERDRLFKRSDAELRVERVRYPPCEDPSRVDVNDRDEVYVPA